MQRLFLIKAHKCGDGCRQYTRQDTGCFVDEEDIKFLGVPSRLIVRTKKSPLENQDFYYVHDEENVPAEADTMIWEDKLKERSRFVYAVSYANLKTHPYLMNSAIREAVRRGQQMIKETIEDRKRTGRIK